MHSGGTSQAWAARTEPPAHRAHRQERLQQSQAEGGGDGGEGAGARHSLQADVRGQLEGVSLHVELLHLPWLPSVNSPCDLKGPGVPVFPRTGLQKVFCGRSRLQLNEELQEETSSNLIGNWASFLRVFISPFSHSKPSVALQSLHPAPAVLHCSLSEHFAPATLAIGISKSILPSPPTFAQDLPPGWNACLFPLLDLCPDLYSSQSHS